MWVYMCDYTALIKRIIDVPLPFRGGPIRRWENIYYGSLWSDSYRLEAKAILKL